MNLDQLGAIVARIQLGDNREVDRVVLAHWQDHIGRLPFDDCLEAVVMHQRESKEYLTVAHVYANVKVIQRRQDRAERVQLSIQNGPPVSPPPTFDKATHEREFRAALAAERVRKGLDPETGKPVADA